MLETFTEATFADKVGQIFRIRVDDTQTIDTRLVAVQGLTSQTADGSPRPSARGPFALTFLGPATPRLPQRMFPIAHDTLGEHQIFIVPVGVRDGGLLYEAVFS